MEFLSNVMQGAGDAKGSGWERLGAGLATAMSGGAGDRTESAAYQDTLLRGHRVQKALMDAQKASAEYEGLGQMRDAIRSMAVPQGMEWLRDFAGGAAVAGKAPDQVMQSLGYAQKNDLLRAATEDFAAGRIEDGQRKLGLYRGQPMELTKIEGNTAYNPTALPSQAMQVTPYGTAELENRSTREQMRQDGMTKRAPDSFDKATEKALREAATLALADARQRGKDVGGLSVEQAMALLRDRGELKALDGTVLARWQVKPPGAESPSAAMAAPPAAAQAAPAAAQSSPQSAARPGAPVTTPKSQVVQALDSVLPPQAAAQLAEGQITQFANGQRWTLRQGMPVRVN